MLENYANIVHIEGITALDMARKEIAPAILGYETFLMGAYMSKKAHPENLPCNLENKLVKKMAYLSDEFDEKLEKLVQDTENMPVFKDTLARAKYCREVLLSDMENLRTVADQTELIIGKKYAPYPLYEDILYSVKY